MEVKLNLRYPSRKESLIKLVIYYDGHRITIPSGEKIQTKFWNKEKQIANRKGFPEWSEFNHKMTSIKTKVRDLFRRFENDNGKPPTPKVFREILMSSILKSQQVEVTDGSEYLLMWYTHTDKTGEETVRHSGYLFDFIQSLPSRHNVKTGRNFSKNTIRNYVVTMGILSSFGAAVLQKRVIKFSDVNLSFYNDLLVYLTTVRKLSPNSIGTHIKNIKAVISYANESGVEVHPAYKSKKFITPQQETDSIYLTESEVEAIVKLDLTSSRRLDRIRDRFIIECRSGLRFSDVVRLNEGEVSEDRIKIRTQKLHEVVTVPVHPDVKDILRKYHDDDSLKSSISNQKFNRYVKEVCSLVPELNKLVNVTKSVEGKKVFTTIPKWQLVTSHTGRRSFATNLYLAGVPVRTIMAILGMSSEDTFFKYIRMTPDDHVKVLESYFNQQLRERMAVVV